ncbi:Heparinase II/III-like protein [Bordetella pseudohinzii]|uniref:Heparinase II/III-like protein n=1 Tax=Bordetella pseudohinzii TaxID=1331258 RepID=A0A0M7DHV3_9BORD|nr:Heparinase II/III-like protein [Bordetella pseudohinzii]
MKIEDFERCAGKYLDVRSLDKWPSANYRWSSIDDFLGCSDIVSGIHSIALEDSSILDVYVDLKVDAPVYVYFHGNCPRADDFKLPVFSGSNVLESLRVTRVVFSDPGLLMDSSLELSWHAGSSRCNLQSAYKAILRKIIGLFTVPEVVFWGGSGGGFAALYYSFFFPGSTAMVWNPQIDILKYLEEPVAKYLDLGFGTRAGDAKPIADHVVHDVAELYRNGYRNRVIYIQNADDWHVQDHLVSFLDALGVDAPSIISSGHNGMVAEDIYLFLGDFSVGHEPPSNVVIHCALRECYAAHGDPRCFDFGRLIEGGHGIGGQCPAWLREGLMGRKIPFFRSDWAHYAAAPAVEADRPYAIKFSTGLTLDFGDFANVDWLVEFDRDATDNIHELYSLTHVGRLLSAYEETRSRAYFLAALGILRSFFDFIEDPDNFDLMMRNRGYSSADHSVSVRSNVFMKFLQIVIAEPTIAGADQGVVDSVIVNLWNAGDYFSNPKNIYPSNHGMMSCLTLAQIANQFRNQGYLSNHYLRRAHVAMLGLIGDSLDRDGWANENTVGYHSFICRLLENYIEYCDKNNLPMVDGERLCVFLRQAKQALEFAVRQDGSIPPIGDSPLYRSEIPSINSSKFFSESGFLIIKDEKIYLTLVCGSRSSNHKQADDSSVTLHYGGEDLIIDGGSYSYDSADIYRKHLVSARGHSGLFVASAADIAPRAYLRQRHVACIDEYVETSSGRFASCRYTLEQDQFECERRLFVDYDGCVLLADRATAQTHESLFCQSFLLAPQLKFVKRIGNAWVFEGSKFGLVVSQSAFDDFSLEIGRVDVPLAGWCSVDWRKLLPTNQLQFFQRGSEARFLTRIRIFDKKSRTDLSEYCVPPVAADARQYLGADGFDVVVPG